MLEEDYCIYYKTATGKINALAMKFLEEHTEGLRWTDLLKKIKQYDPELHPKTVNGCVWRLTERFPDLVYKPSKGVFRLIKYR